VAFERPAIRDLIARVEGKAKQQIGERVARERTAESILPTEVDTTAEAVARHVARPQDAGFQGVTASDPRQVVAERESILLDRAVDVPRLVGDIGRAV
jgi:hypothetical protein